MKTLFCLLFVLTAANVVSAQAIPILTPEQRLQVEIENWVAEVAKRDQQILALKIELGRALELAAPAILARAQDDFTKRLELLKASVEATHPEHTWDPQTGKFSPKQD